MGQCSVSLNRPVSQCSIICATAEETADVDQPRSAGFPQGEAEAAAGRAKGQGEEAHRQDGEAQVARPLQPRSRNEVCLGFPELGARAPSVGFPSTDLVLWNDGLLWSCACAYAVFVQALGEEPIRGDTPGCGTFRCGFYARVTCWRSGFRQCAETGRRLAWGRRDRNSAYHAKHTRRIVLRLDCRCLGRICNVS